MRVRAALARITNPESGRSIVADGMVAGLTVDAGGSVRFSIEASDRARAERLAEEARRVAAGEPGVQRVTAIATTHGPAAHGAATRASAPAGGHANPLGLKTAKGGGDRLSGVKRVIAIASGKGGVGKSTVAANLAVALARAGKRTGLLDADIYGPSLPTLFGLSGKVETRDGKLVPFERFGVRAMSIGLLVEPEQALAWRGPMVMGAVRQLIDDVDWGALDYLLIDTPPGTGDAHLTLAQTRLLSGAVIVSTPQEMALADVRRGAAFFRKTGVDVLGVIENMAWLETPDGARHDLFGRGGAERVAAEIGAPFLGALPLWPELRAASDTGTPASADSPAGRAFAALAALIDRNP